ncbi:proteinase-activated receptor 3-like [Cynoglossus semilaevis]|uniref:Proteinase-activated receptor 3-like n=1 Tax=Cynoglossus semilaevis TaxID=244447 RepID=A0A3P8WTN6_CYNSE|nr:proteinase-activated receptor 3-like [Cynoglossus semilaevis]
MEQFNHNISELFTTVQPENDSVIQKTRFEGCIHMPATIIWYMTMQFINMCLGVPANITVLWLVYKNKGDSSNSGIFIFQLAVLDLLFCLSLSFEIVDILFITSSTVPYILRFFYGIKDTSPLVLACICLDRYIAVLHPIAFTRLKDRQYRAVLAGVVWVIILGYSIASCAKIIPSAAKVYMGMILGPFAFMVFCNIAILWALRQSGPGRDEMHPVKKRAFKMVLIILAIIVFHYCPPVVLFPFQDYFSPDVFRCQVHYGAFGVMDFSSTVQPMLYLSRGSLPRILNCF